MRKRDSANDQNDMGIVGKNIILPSLHASFLNRPCFTGSFLSRFYKKKKTWQYFQLDSSPPETE